MNRTEEKGPIEYFNRTKESLKHVTHIQHDSNEEKSSVGIVNEMNEHETDESSYVKIPVQQLINTFEKQMRSIIKQKINENIQLTASSNKISATYINKDNIETENVTNLNEQFTTPIVSSFAELSEIQQSHRVIEQQQLSHSINELRSMQTQNTTTEIVKHEEFNDSTKCETTIDRSDSNGTQQNDHGGKTQQLHFSPVFYYHSLMSMLTI